MRKDPSYFIGVDTGGTYTDAVIIAVERHQVIAAAKAITTKGDLAVGVNEAITAAMAQLPEEASSRRISLVSVSTTLATNAVVEGHGSSVGVILAGFDQQMAARTGIAEAFPGIAVECIVGGHDHNGEEIAPLDVAGLERALARGSEQVDAYAVAAAFAVRNPAHEERARDIIAARTGKPVTISTELSSALDAPRRALTAVLNARLISRISLLIGAVEKTMRNLGISCPLMIVKGDGTMGLARRIALRPIETVLSGPAASLVGARWLSGRDDFIMCDMGGTTTDLGILAGGRPRISQQGADIGGWRTMVKAIDAKTIGLGGDSEVAFGIDSRLTIGPGRIVPVSLVAARYPELSAMLDGDLAETEGGSLLGKFVLRPFGGASPAATARLSPREAEVLAEVTERPRPIRKVALPAGAQRAIQSLKRKGLVQLCGFTPSDAAHVLGFQDNWSRDAAEKAARLLVRFRDMKTPGPERLSQFCREVWGEVVRLTGRAILEAAFGGPIGGETLVEAVCVGEGNVGLARVQISPTVPVVAVGAPVKIYYQEVGRRLGAEIIFPPFYEVANAIGAATSLVARAVTMTVEGDGSGLFRVHGPTGTRSFASAGAAIAEAEAAALALARQSVREAGGTDPEIEVSIKRHLLPDTVNDDGLLSATVTAEAVGRPDEITGEGAGRCKDR
jgi:N-methylhydantoinase A/oxoprolinase/acetone carboxylase beta subunit